MVDEIFEGVTGNILLADWAEAHCRMSFVGGRLESIAVYEIFMSNYMTVSKAQMLHFLSHVCALEGTHDIFKNISTSIFLDELRRIGGGSILKLWMQRMDTRGVGTITLEHFVSCCHKLPSTTKDYQGIWHSLVDDNAFMELRHLSPDEGAAVDDLVKHFGHGVDAEQAWDILCPSGHGKLANILQVLKQRGFTGDTQILLSVSVAKPRSCHYLYKEAFLRLWKTSLIVNPSTQSKILVEWLEQKNMKAEEFVDILFENAQVSTSFKALLKMRWSRNRELYKAGFQAFQKALAGSLAFVKARDLPEEEWEFFIKSRGLPDRTSSSSRRVSIAIAPPITDRKRVEQVMTRIPPDRKRQDDSTAKFNNAVVKPARPPLREKQQEASPMSAFALDIAVKTRALPQEGTGGWQGSKTSSKGSERQGSKTSSNGSERTWSKTSSKRSAQSDPPHVPLDPRRIMIDDALMAIIGRPKHDNNKAVVMSYQQLIKSLKNAKFVGLDEDRLLKELRLHRSASLRNPDQLTKSDFLDFMYDRIPGPVPPAKWNYTDKSRFRPTSAPAWRDTFDISHNNLGKCYSNKQLFSKTVSSQKLFSVPGTSPNRVGGD